MTSKTALWLLLAFVAGYALAQGTHSGREPQLDNPDVKVWKSVILPDDPLPLHRHEHPRVIVALQGGTLKFQDENGASQTQEWRSGKAYWLPADAPGVRHQDINIGARPIEVMVVELQKAW